MVATLVIGTWITTDLPTQEGWKAELAWVGLHVPREPARQSNRVEHRDGHDRSFRNTAKPIDKNTRSYTTTTVVMQQYHNMKSCSECHFPLKTDIRAWYKISQWKPTAKYYASKSQINQPLTVVFSTFAHTTPEYEM